MNAAELSFVKSTPNGRTWWNVTPTGDYWEDHIYGEKLALEYLTYAATEGVPIFPWIISAMPRKLSVIEVAFLTLISIAAAGGRPAAVRTHEFWNKQRAA